MVSTKRKKLKLKLRKAEFEVTGSPAGLARTHKIIRTEQAKEIQFMKLCTQILLNENKKERSERQRNDRIAKRKQTRMNIKQTENQ